MHLQQFQERKFQKFTGVLPSDPLSFARQTWVPQNILPSYGNITSIPVSIGIRDRSLFTAAVCCMPGLGLRKHWLGSKTSASFKCMLVQFLTAVSTKKSLKTRLSCVKIFEMEKYFLFSPNLDH